MRVLGIGSHPDDLELGCAGTLANHVARGDDVIMLIVTDGTAGSGPVAERRREALDGAAVLGVTDVVFGSLPDGSVSNHELDLVHLIEATCRQYKIDMVYTHGAKDSHQDHRAVAMASMGACRAVRQVLCYDSPSSLGFNPSVFVDITASLDKKISALQMHASQVEHSTMASAHLVRTQAGYRGFQARVEAAEGFEPLRFVLPL